MSDDASVTVLTSREKNRLLLLNFATAALSAFPELRSMSGALNIHPTDAIDGMQIKDGFVVACHDAKSRAGITAVAWGEQHFKAYVEMVASRPENWEERAAGFAMGSAIKNVVTQLGLPKPG